MSLAMSNVCLRGPSSRFADCVTVYRTRGTSAVFRRPKGYCQRIIGKETKTTKWRRTESFSACHRVRVIGMAGTSWMRVRMANGVPFVIGKILSKFLALTSKSIWMRWDSREFLTPLTRVMATMVYRLRFGTVSGWSTLSWTRRFIHAMNRFNCQFGIWSESREAFRRIPGRKLTHWQPNWSDCHRIGNTDGRQSKAEIRKKSLRNGRMRGREKAGWWPSKTKWNKKLTMQNRGRPEIKSLAIFFLIDYLLWLFYWQIVIILFKLLVFWLTFGLFLDIFIDYVWPFVFIVSCGVVISLLSMVCYAK